MKTPGCRVEVQRGPPMPRCGPPSCAPRSEVGRVFQAKTVARGAWRVSSLCQPRGAPVPRPGVWTLPSRDREEGAPRARLSPTDKAPRAQWGLSSPECARVCCSRAEVGLARPSSDSSFTTRPAQSGPDIPSHLQGGETEAQRDSLTCSRAMFHRCSQGQKGGAPQCTRTPSKKAGPKGPGSRPHRPPPNPILAH